MWTNNKIWKKIYFPFTAEVDEVVRMRFPPPVVFSNVQRVSKIILHRQLQLFGKRLWCRSFFGTWLCVWFGQGMVQCSSSKRLSGTNSVKKPFCSQIACFPHAFLDMFLNLVWQPRPLLRQKRGSPRLLAACASPEATVTFVFSTAFKMNATIFCSFVGFWWSNVWLKILWYKACFQRFLNFELYWIEAYPHYFQMYLIESSFRE